MARWALFSILVWKVGDSVPIKMRMSFMWILAIFFISFGCKKNLKNKDDIVRHKVETSNAAAELAKVKTHTLYSVDTSVELNTQTTVSSDTQEQTSVSTRVFNAHVLIRNARTEYECNAAKGKWATDGSVYKCEQTVEACIELGPDVIIDPANRSHCIHAPVQLSP